MSPVTAARAAVRYRSQVVETCKSLALPPVKRPSATALFATGLADRLPGMGEYAFFWMSGVAHGRPSALLKGLDASPGGVAGFVASAVLAMPTFRLAAEGANALVQGWCSYRGTSPACWDGELADAIGAVRLADQLARELVAAARTAGQR